MADLGSGMGDRATRGRPGLVRQDRPPVPVPALNRLLHLVEALLQLDQVLAKPPPLPDQRQLPCDPQLAGHDPYLDPAQPFIGIHSAAPGMCAGQPAGCRHGALCATDAAQRGRYQVSSLN